MDTLSALRLLTRFDLSRKPAGGRSPLRDVPWAELADVAMVHGVAPIVAYNLEYQLGGGGAPDEIRDRLLGYYQGTLNDNVFKLVNLKGLLHGLELPVVLLGAAAWADAIYPHVAFRPVPDVQLLAARENFFQLAQQGEPMGMKLGGEEAGAVVLTDGRTRFLLYDAVFGAQRTSAEGALFERGVRARVFGERVVRPAIEDAVLTQVALMARAGFEAPLIEFVDLRELVLGSPGQSGTYHRPPEAGEVLERAEESGLSRALYCAMRLLAWFFPEQEPQAAAITPHLNVAVRAALDKVVVEPAQALEREHASRSVEQIRKLLL